jgi:hypothetical protein
MMATDLTDAAASRVANWVTTNSTTAPTGPLKTRLMTANGSGSSAGTEVVGGSYAAQSVTFGSSSAGSTVSNSADLTYPNMPACTVVGVEVWDSAGTPFRWLFRALASPVAVSAGNTFTIPAGSLTVDPTP